MPSLSPAGEDGETVSNTLPVLQQPLFMCHSQTLIDDKSSLLVFSAKFCFKEKALIQRKTQNTPHQQQQQLA